MEYFNIYLPIAGLHFNVLVLLLIGGSVAELLIAGAAHTVTSRRPGCFAGLTAALAIMAGCSVMLWAFGPGIILLFLYKARKPPPGRCPACGYDVRGLPEFRCPECGRPFTPREVGMTVEQLRDVSSPDRDPRK